MTAVPTVWEFFSLLCKLLVYAGLAASVGGVLCLWLGAGRGRWYFRPLLVYILVAVTGGFHGSLLYLLLQVGGINDAGVVGMFDWGMIDLLLAGPIGEATLLRLGGFLWLAVSAGAALWRVTGLSRPPTLGFLRLLNAGMAVGIVLLAFSFRAMGHLATQAAAGQVAIIVHVIAMGAWAGSLWPLLLLALKLGDEESLSGEMRRFGQVAPVFVTILLLTGVWLGWSLTGAPAKLLTSAYGLVLTAKLTAVAALVGLAALNRQILVPTLGRGSAARLRASIRLEMLLMLLIFALTTWLSTLMEPPAHL